MSNITPNHSIRHQLSQNITDIQSIDTQVLLIPLFKNGTFLCPDKALNALGQSALEQTNRFKGEAGDTWRTHTPEGYTTQHIIWVGLGDANDLTPSNLRRSMAAGIRAARSEQFTQITLLINDAWENGLGGNVQEISNSLQWATEGLILASYQFRHRKTEATLQKSPPVESINIVTMGLENQTEAIQAGFNQGQITALATNSARNMVFDSANHITPSALKTWAEALDGLSCQVVEQTEMEKLGMGAFISVAKGSDEPAYLIHLTYTPETPSGKSVALVGKGVTFDSGGLSLKPSKSMELMKLDMAGAAAVLNTMQAIAELAKHDQPIHHTVHGFVALCENMPSGHASKPGDIVTTMNGKTVEINNTDAEGRLILIDTLTYAQQQTQPDVIIDLATLTGAAVAALGETAAAVMSPSDALCETICEQGNTAGENFWRLPLYDDYKKSLESDVADLINAGSKGQAGTASAALFLKEFIDDNREWAHLDIAGPAYTNRDKPEVPKGASGFGVRTLVNYLKHSS